MTDIGRGLSIGFFRGASFALACVAWGADWNTYIALTMSIVFIVLSLTSIAALTERERRTRS